MLNKILKTSIFYPAALALLALAAGCGKPSAEATDSKAATGVEERAHKIPAGQEFAGFLKDYSKLKPNQRFEGEALTYASEDAQKSLRSYLAIVVDPVDTYLASDADEAKVPEKSRAAAKRYFQWALTKAVADAYPIVDEPGPLVLRLRAALIGVDVGGEIPASDRPADPKEVIEHAVNIGKVGVELELVDSESGEQIAAMVDRKPLGEGASIASANIPMHEKSLAAREAFDEWAARVREFLDSENELSDADAQRASQSYQPYSASAAGQ